jgi:hypothetical protein
MSVLLTMISSSFQGRAIPVGIIRWSDRATPYLRSDQNAHLFTHVVVNKIGRTQPNVKSAQHTDL